MKRTNFILFLLLDFSSLAAVFLIFTYYGMCHILLLFLGLLFFFLGIYDLRTGVLSLLIRQLFGLSRKEKQSGILNLIPVMLSVIVVLYSLPLLLQHGLINTSQESLMQGNIFIQFTIMLIGATLFVLIAAAGSYFWGGRKDN